MSMVVQFSCGDCGDFESSKYYKSSHRKDGKTVSDVLVSRCPVCDESVESADTRRQVRASTIYNPTPPKARNGRPSIEYHRGWVPADLAKLLEEERKLRETNGKMECPPEEGVGSSKSELSMPDIGESE